jgi:hypothetical protein
LFLLVIGTSQTDMAATTITEAVLRADVVKRVAEVAREAAPDIILILDRFRWSWGEPAHPRRVLPSQEPRDHGGYDQTHTECEPDRDSVVDECVEHDFLL